MSVLPMISDWRRQGRDEPLPDLHGHQANSLADLSFAMTVAEHCHSGKLAAVAPGDTTPAATKRRIERALANDRLDPDSAWPWVVSDRDDGPRLFRRYAKRTWT